MTNVFVEILLLNDACEVTGIEAEEPPVKFLIVQNTSGKVVRLMVERKLPNPLKGT